MNLSRTTFSLALVVVLCLGLAMLTSSPSEALFLCDEVDPIRLCEPLEGGTYIGRCWGPEGMCDVYRLSSWERCKRNCTMP